MDNQQVPISPIQDFDTAYLDQIATPSNQRSSFFSGKILILFGALAAVLVFAIVLMFANSGKSPKLSSETLYLRTTNMQKIATQQHKNLKNGSLRAINATYQVQLTGIIQQLNTEFEKLKISPKKIAKELTASEQAHVDKINKALEESRLNTYLDRDYAKEMSYQIELMISTIQKIERTAESGYKEMLAENRTYLKLISNQFSKFTD